MSTSRTGHRIHDAQRAVRARAEHHLREDAAGRLGAGQPRTVAAYRAPGGRLWRGLFVPAYRRLPWALTQRGMSAARMTARGWTPPRREPAEPWRPPPGVLDRMARPASDRGGAPDAGSADAPRAQGGAA